MPTAEDDSCYSPKLPDDLTATAVMVEQINAGAQYPLITEVDYDRLWQYEIGLAGSYCSKLIIEADGKRGAVELRTAADFIPNLVRRLQLNLEGLCFLKGHLQGLHGIGAVEIVNDTTFRRGKNFAEARIVGIERHRPES